MSQEMVLNKTKIKELRNQTGAGISDCKKALDASKGDVNIAIETLRKKGLASADKKSTRIAAEGIIESYIHNGSKLGILVEVNCETDFVTKDVRFRALAKDIAMQLAACPSVEYIDIENIPDAVVSYEKNIEANKDDLKGKPDEIIQQIVEGRIKKRLQELSLMNQAFIKNLDISIEEVIKQYISLFGENIRIRRFSRFVLGQGLEKKSNSFAEEVSQIMDGNN